MIRSCLIALAATVFFAVATQRAEAQYNGSSDNPVGPTVSPYLNLLQSGSFGVTNYQSLVRPLVQQGNAINRQGSQLNRLQQQQSVGAAASRGYGGATGHTTFFMNYSHFYPQPSQR